MAKTHVLSPAVNGIEPAYSLLGTGMTKTSDIGGSRFGAWSQIAFSPTSYVQETLTSPIAQLSPAVTLPQLPYYTAAQLSTPAQQSAVSAPSGSPQSANFWIIGAIVFLGVVFVLKRKKKIK